MPFATTKPEYSNARRNSHFNHISPFFVLHETWSRSIDDLRQKLDSWGHEKDFESKSAYLEFWASMNEENFNLALDFHPLRKGVWHKLRFFETAGIGELQTLLTQSDFLTTNRFRYMLRNSRNYQRAVQWSNKLFGWLD